MAANPAPTVLVVEDEPLIRQLLTDLLRGEGYNVLVARNGCDALRTVNEQPVPAKSPRVVLLDMMLPGIDGIGVLQQLAAPGDRVPVVAMSASRQYLVAAQATGADAVLSKPFDLDHL